MFVLQNRLTEKYVRRVLGIEGYGNSKDTYMHVEELNRATVFNGWSDLADWINARLESQLYFQAFPTEWIIVEVRNVPQPQVEVVKVIG